MSRTLAAAILLTGLAPAPAAPALKGKEVGLYFPTREGDRLEYEAESGGAAPAMRITEVVSKVEKKDGALLVSVSRELNGRATVPSTYSVSDRGVTRVGTSGRELPVPVPLLKLPAKPGDTWTYEPAVPAGVRPRQAVYTMGKEEEVEVPAGKFKALRVESEQDIGGGRVYKTTFWYAPGVGLVKSVSNVGGNERTQVLKSFTPGE